MNNLEKLKNTQPPGSPFSGTPKSEWEQNELNMFENQFLSFQSSSYTQEAINVIINKGGQILYDKYLIGQSPFYEAEDICRCSVQLVKQEYLTHDKGETPEGFMNQLTEENEPKGQHLDSRSCLSARTEYKYIYEEVELDDLSDTKSNTSRMSNMSKLSKSSALKKIKNVITASKLFGSAIFKSSSQLQNDDTEGEENANKEPEMQIPKIIYMGEDGEEEKNQIEYQNDPLTEKLRDIREKKDKEKQLDQARKHKMNQEELEIDDRIKEQERQLKNKEYTQDFDGKIIFLNKNRQESLPTDILTLEVKNKFQTDILKAAPTEAEIMQIPVKLLNDYSKKKKGNIGEVPPLEFHKQPPLNDILNPAQGVKISFSTNQKKSGGDLKHKETQMSKKQYEKIISEQPNRPVPKYLSANKQKVNIDNNAQIIEITEQSSNQSTHRKISRPFSPGIHVANKDMLNFMLQDPAHPLLRKSSGNLGMSQQSSQKELPPVKSQMQEPFKVKTIAYLQDKIKIYDKRSPRDTQGSGEEGQNQLQKLGINLKIINAKPQQHLTQIVEQFNRKIISDPSWGTQKELVDPSQKPSHNVIRVPSATQRIQSARSYRPDSANSKFSIKSSYEGMYARPSSGRPTAANTNSKISSNQKSSFLVKQN